MDRSVYICTDIGTVIGVYIASVTVMETYTYAVLQSCIEASIASNMQIYRFVCEGRIMGIYTGTHIPNIVHIYRGSVTGIHTVIYICSTIDMDGCVYLIRIMSVYKLVFIVSTRGMDRGICIARVIARDRCVYTGSIIGLNMDSTMGIYRGQGEDQVLEGIRDAISERRY
jgi:hypothetical protein